MPDSAPVQPDEVPAAIEAAALTARLLRPVRHRAAIAYASPRACSESQRDVPRLLAAVDAVLKLVHDARPGMTDCICADCETSRGNGFSGIHRPRPGALVDAIAVLEAIIRELTGATTASETEVQDGLV